MTAETPVSLATHWENTLIAAGFQWPTNETAALFKLCLQEVGSFKTISKFFIFHSQNLFGEPACLNAKLFFMLSKNLDFMPPALAESEDMKMILDQLHKIDATSMRFFRKYFIVSERELSGKKFEMYLDIVNGNSERLKEEKFVISVPHWIYAFMFFFDDEQKELLSFKQQSQLYSAKEVSRLAFNSFEHLDLALVGAELCDQMTEVVIYFEKEMDTIHTNSQLFIEFFMHHFQDYEEERQKVDGFNIADPETITKIESFLQHFSRDLKSVLVEDKFNSLVKRVFTDLKESVESSYDFAKTPVHFALYVRSSLLIHDSKSLKKEMSETSQSLFQSLFRTEQLISGHVITEEESNAGTFTQRECALGQDIKLAMNFQKELMKEQYPEATNMPTILHPIQHMVNIMKAREQISPAEFTKLLVEINSEAGYSLLFCMYAGIDNVYDWYLVFKGFVNSKKYTTMYMESLKKEYDDGIKAACSSGQTNPLG